jgi:hypothetical protein
MLLETYAIWYKAETYVSSVNEQNFNTKSVLSRKTCKFDEKQYL